MRISDWSSDVCSSDLTNVSFDALGSKRVVEASQNVMDAAEHERLVNHQAVLQKITANDIPKPTKLKDACDDQHAQRTPYGRRFESRPGAHKNHKPRLHGALHKTCRQKHVANNTSDGGQNGSETRGEKWCQNGEI